LNFSNFDHSLEFFASFLFQDKKEEPVRLEDKAFLLIRIHLSKHLKLLNTNLNRVNNEYFAKITILCCSFESILVGFGIIIRIPFIEEMIAFRNQQKN